MKQRKRIILLLSTAIIAVGSLVTFMHISRTDKTVPDEPEILPEEITTPDTENKNSPVIYIWHQFEANTPEERYLRELVDELISDNHLSIDEYRVDIHSYPGTEMRNQLLAANQKNELPNLVFADPEWLPELVRLDILHPLDAYDGYPDISSRLSDGVIETGRRGEHIYGIPFSITLHMLDLNISDEDTLGTDVIDIMDIAPYLWSNGGELMNADHTKATGYLDSESNIAIIKALTTMLKEGSDPEYENLYTIERQTKNNAVLSSTLLAIPKAGGTDIGWELIKALTSEEIQTEFARLGVIPANKNALNSETAANAGFAPFIQSLETARALPNVSEWKEMNNEFSIAMKRIIEGYKSAEQGMKDLAVIWDALLP